MKKGRNVPSARARRLPETEAAFFGFFTPLKDVGFSRPAFSPPAGKTAVSAFRQFQENPSSASSFRVFSELKRVLNPCRFMR